MYVFFIFYTIKVFHQKRTALFTGSKFLMGIGGKCKDNINMADFEEYVALIFSPQLLQ
jgi:hypothetical protein